MKLFSPVFAETAPNLTAPTNLQIQTGWPTGTVPPSDLENGFQNRQEAMIKYMANEVANVMLDRSIALIPGDEHQLSNTLAGIIPGLTVPRNYIDGLETYLEETLGSQLITSWTNDLTNPYNTFTTSADVITQAIRNTAGTKLAHSNTFTGIPAGNYVRLDIDLNRTSGARPFFRLLTAADTAASADTQLLVDGVQTVYLLTTDVAAKIQVSNQANGNWGSTGLPITLKALIHDPRRHVFIPDGTTADDTNVQAMILSGPLFKDIKSVWAPGNGNGGLPSALTLTPSTWYHYFLQYDNSGPTYDAGYDTSINATNLLIDNPMPYKKRIWSVFVDSNGDIKYYFQRGGWCYWDTPLLAWNATLTATGSLIPLLTPPGITCMANLSSYMNTDSGVAYYHPPFVQNLVSIAALSMIGIHTATGSNNEVNATQIMSLTDTNSRIFVRGNTTQSIQVSTLSYFDYRGKY